MLHLDRGHNLSMLAGLGLGATLMYFLDSRGGGRRRALVRDKSVKAGSTVSVAPWLMHRHRTHWQRPDVFDPERFQTESGKDSLRSAYLPFSLGPRVCLGASFAMQEATLILASLARRYRFEPLPDHVPKPIGRLTIRSENGIRLRIHRR